MPNIYLRGMKLTKLYVVVLLCMFFFGCREKANHTVPIVGIVDYLEDASLKPAVIGFEDALKKNGFSEDKKTIRIEYRNAQQSIPTLTQIVNYFIEIGV